MAFEGAAGNDDALWVGTLMHQALAGITFGVGVIMLSIRNMQSGTAPVFRGFAIGSLGIISVACYHWATQPGPTAGRIARDHGRSGHLFMARSRQGCLTASLLDEMPFGQQFEGHFFVPLVLVDEVLGIKTAGAGP